MLLLHVLASKKIIGVSDKNLFRNFRVINGLSAHKDFGSNVGLNGFLDPLVQLPHKLV
jgi:hypothetical protein